MNLTVIEGKRNLIVQAPRVEENIPEWEDIIQMNMDEFMHVQIEEDCITYSCPKFISLSKRLENPINEFDFHMIIAQIARAYKIAHHIGLTSENVVWNPEMVFMSPTTREMKFILLLNKEENDTTFQSLLEEVIYSVKQSNMDDSYISEFVYHLKRLDAFDYHDILSYITEFDSKVTRLLQLKKPISYERPERKVVVSEFQTIDSIQEEETSVPEEIVEPEEMKEEVLEEAVEIETDEEIEQVPVSEEEPVQEKVEESEEIKEEISEELVQEEINEVAEPEEVEPETVEEVQEESGETVETEEVQEETVEPEELDAEQEVEEQAVQEEGEESDTDIQQEGTEEVFEEPILEEEKPEKISEEMIQEVPIEDAEPEEVGEEKKPTRLSFADMFAEGSQDLVRDEDNDYYDDFEVSSKYTFEDMNTDMDSKIEVEYYLIRESTQDNIPIDREEFVLGKSNYVEGYSVKGNPGVSRKHAMIVKENDRYVIQDLGSVNGTYVNGEAVEAQRKEEIHDGDIIELGNEKFMLKRKGND